MKTVIMAGGKGSRIAAIANDIPKPMIKIADKPILQLEIEALRDQGLKDFIITISHLGETIKDYFQDGKKFGVNITYYFEETPLGNAGALFKIKEQLKEDFLLINGDVLFNVDIKRFIKFHQEKKALVSLFTHPNNHPYDSGLLITDDDKMVINWLSKEDERPKYYQNIVNAGIHLISPEILNIDINKEKIDLDRDLLKPLCNTGKMYAYNSCEYVKDMGTPQRYQQVIDDYYSGKIKQRSLLNKQKAIFLDRDGTINKYCGFLNDIDKFELLADVSEAIKKINESAYLAIVVTNQPVVARGEISFEGLKQIHNKMETLLGNKGAYLDAIYFCPHHPDKGFENEVKELKIVCDCRKPKPGMLIRAGEDFNLDLSASYMIGDSDSDILAGSAVNCKCIKIDRDGSLLKAVNQIIGE